MRKSKYGIFVQTAEQVYAVSLLSRAAMTLSPSAYQFVELVSAEGPPNNLDTEETRLFNELCKGLFLVDDDFDELAYIRCRYHQEWFGSAQFGHDQADPQRQQGILRRRIRLARTVRDERQGRRPNAASAVR